MAYAAIIAARQSQFGSSVIEWNLADDNGVLPPQRVTVKLRTEKPTARQINDALAAVIVNATAAAQSEARRRGDVGAMRSRLAGFLDAKIEEARAAFMDQVESSGLTATQKDIAREVRFDWRL